MNEINNTINETQNSESTTQMPQGELPDVTPPTAELEELQKQVEMYKDLLLRKAAEFENYKRRSEQEIASVIKYANEALLLDLLPIVDDLERSLKHCKENANQEALVKGIELIYQKFIKVLENRGVKMIETVGKEFNVDYHDALMQVPRDDVPPLTVVEEVEKGYLLNDKVLRHAKVIVSSSPFQSSSDESGKKPENN
ncbi:MAG: nucleotide exchange factor GrpE [Bacteroidetes bacterium]|nr:nucleotide exchange factor GrpE [Bacteroidota bacterium]